MKTYTFDFKTAIGYTLMEKYESLFLCIVNVWNDLEANHSVIIASPEITCFFEIATCGFEPNRILQQMGDFTYVGKLTHHKYHPEIYSSKTIAKDIMLMSANNQTTMIKIDNFRQF